MGRAARDLDTPRALERALGQRLFDRYPHLVPSPVWMTSMASLIQGLGTEAERRRYAKARPLQVLEAWFDCWAALALRDPHGCHCGDGELVDA